MRSASRRPEPRRILQIEGTPVPAGVWSAGRGDAWDPGRSDDDARGIRYDVVEGRPRAGDSDGGRISHRGASGELDRDQQGANQGMEVRARDHASASR